MVPSSVAAACRVQRIQRAGLSTDQRTTDPTTDNGQRTTDTAAQALTLPLQTDRRYAQPHHESVPVPHRGYRAHNRAEGRVGRNQAHHPSGRWAVGQLFQAAGRGDLAPQPRECEDAGGLDESSRGISPPACRDAGPLADAAKDRSQGHDHRHRRSPAVHRREALFPVDAAAVCHRQPLHPQGPDPARTRDLLRLRPRQQQEGWRELRLQDLLSAPRRVVRPQRLRVPDRQHAATRRDRGHPSRHLSREHVVVAFAWLHARGRRGVERHSRAGLPDIAQGGRTPAASA